MTRHQPWPEGWPEGMNRCDEYLSDEVLEACRPLKVVSFGKNLAADILYLTYRAFPKIRVFEIRKEAPVIVVGQVKKDIIFATAESEEGKGARVPAESFILRSPFRPDRWYFNTLDKFRKLYGDDEGGLKGRIYEGPIPKAKLEGIRDAWNKFGLRM